jgi:UDP:flavonoid glycosyltransferase YjiC (YdhE family)
VGDLDAAFERMRVIVSACYGSRGDVVPCLRLAEAFARLGADVRVLANPMYASEARNDLRFVGVGSAKAYEEMLKGNASRRGVRMLVRYWLSHLDEHTGKLIALCRERSGENEEEDVVVLAHTLDFAVRCLEEHNERSNEFKTLRFYSIVLSPALLRGGTRRIPPYFAGAIVRFETQCGVLRRFAERFADWLVDSVFAPALNSFRYRVYGIKTPVRGVFHRWFLTSNVLAMWPAYFEATTSMRTLLQVDFPSSDVSKDLSGDSTFRRAIEFVRRDSRPCVVFVSASGNPPHAKVFFRLACRAMSRLTSMKAIMLTKHKDGIQKLIPENVKLFDFVPLTSLLAHSSMAVPTMAVHHASMGCIAATVRAGVPSLIVPAVLDQHYNADVLKEMGIVRVVKMSNLSRRLLVREIQATMTSESVAKCVASVTKRANEDTRSAEERAASLITKCSTTQIGF